MPEIARLAPLFAERALQCNPRVRTTLPPRSLPPRKPRVCQFMPGRILAIGELRIRCLEQLLERRAKAIGMTGSAVP